MRRFLRQIQQLILAFLLLAASGCSRQNAADAAEALSSAASAAVSAVPTVSAVPVFQVQAKPLLDTLDEVRQQFPDLIYSSYQLNGIPVLEVKPEQADADTPLVIFMHGVTGSKEFMGFILSEFAAHGFRAVSFDLPGHGERTDGAYMFLDLIEQAEKDLTTILDYDTQKGYPTAHYGLGGFSAGGMIAYSYAMTGKYPPDVLIPVSTVADWDEIKQSPLLDDCYQNSALTEPIRTHEEELQLLQKDNPYEYLYRLKDTTVLIAHGTEDTTFSDENAERTAADLKSLGSESVTVCLYDTDHSFPNAFLAVMIEQLTAVLG